MIVRHDAVDGWKGVGGGWRKLRGGDVVVDEIHGYCSLASGTPLTTATITTHLAKVPISRQNLSRDSILDPRPRQALQALE